MSAGLGGLRPAVGAAGSWRGGVGDGLRYGALGLPLAFVALPLYVILPAHYASVHGVTLAALGALLLAVRLVDAITDPLIGRWADGWLSTPARLAAVLGTAALALAIAFRALFFPPDAAAVPLLAWIGFWLTLASLAYGVLGVTHQAWGARLGGGAAQRARIVAWREGLALAGVLAASVLPSLAGLDVTTAVFAVLLAIGAAMLARAPRPGPVEEASPAPPWSLPLRTPAFRRLLAVYLVNGIAGAVPATLVLFFVRDRLQQPVWEPVFLAAYFAAGALSMPLWVRAVARWGLARAWLAGMALSIAAFAGAAGLGSGDAPAFLAVCVATGLALGADLALPGAMLAGLVQRLGLAGRQEGAFFGWWSFATKLNLALASGIALPALAVLGYEPGRRDAAALGALTLAYCALPCLLKALAAALLWRRWIRHPESRDAPDLEPA